MAESKETSNEKAPAEPLQVTSAPDSEQVVNLYFFPDIQKSVEATSIEEAQKQVQAELDAFAKEGN